MTSVAEVVPRDVPVTGRVPTPGLLRVRPYPAPVWFGLLGDLTAGVDSLSCCFPVSSVGRSLPENTNDKTERERGEELPRDLHVWRFGAFLSSPVKTAEDGPTH